MTTAIVIATETPHTAFPTRITPEQTSASGVDSSARRRVPLTMPRAQQYYWGSVWQTTERANLAEMAAGRGVRFDSGDPADAAQWLDAPDDTDAD